MALINCSECSREISDKAEACPHCGCPRQQLLPETVCCLDCRKDFPFNDEVCPFCGLFNSQKHNLLAELKPELEVITVTDQDTAVICPKCRARNAYSAQKRGLSLKRAVFFGLIGGAIGKDKIVVTCLKCGHKWSP